MTTLPESLDLLTQRKEQIDTMIPEQPEGKRRETLQRLSEVYAGKIDRLTHKQDANER